MKKNYITPEIKVMQLEALCSGDYFVTASVYEKSTDGDCIDNFDVVNEDKTKDKDIWGESNSNKWGDD